MFPEKLRTVGSNRLRRRTTGHKCDLVGEVAGPGTSRQYRAAILIAFTDDLEWSVLTNGPKNPFGVVRRGQAPRPIAVISHRQAHQLNWLVCWDENQKILMELTADMRITSVALAV